MISKKHLGSLVLTAFFALEACSSKPVPITLNKIEQVNKPKELETYRLEPLSPELSDYKRVRDIYRDLEFPEECCTPNCHYVCEKYQRAHKKESQLDDKEARKVLDNIREEGIDIAVFQKKKDPELFYGLCCWLFDLKAVKAAQQEYLKKKNIPLL